MVVYADYFTEEQFYSDVLSGIALKVGHSASDGLSKWIDLGFEIDYFHKQEPGIDGTLFLSSARSFGMRLFHFVEEETQSFYLRGPNMRIFDQPPLIEVFMVSDIEQHGFDTTQSRIFYHNLSHINIQEIPRYTLQEAQLDIGDVIYTDNFPVLQAFTYFGPVFVSEGMSNDFINYVFGGE